MRRAAGLFFALLAQTAVAGRLYSSTGLRGVKGANSSLSRVSNSTGLRGANGTNFSFSRESNLTRLRGANSYNFSSSRLSNSTRLSSAAQAKGTADRFQILEDAYEGKLRKERSGAHGMSGDDAKAWKAAGIHKNTNTYGEISPEGIQLLLQRVGAKPGQNYYDLGAGDGKTTMVAWLMGLNATGIELSEQRFQASCAATDRLRNLRGSSGRHLQFFHGSVTDLDFADADVVYIMSVCFDAKLMNRIALAAKSLKKGARILSYQTLIGKDFVKRGEYDVKGTFQASNVTIHDQEKVTEASPVGSSIIPLAKVPQKDRCHL